MQSLSFRKELTEERVPWRAAAVSLLISFSILFFVWLQFRQRGRIYYETSPSPSSQPLTAADPATEQNVRDYQKEAMRLFAALDESVFKFEVAHRDVLKRFGRYPRRNVALGRPSTAAELAYMEDTGNRMF